MYEYLNNLDKVFNRSERIIENLSLTQTKEEKIQ